MPHDLRFGDCLDVLRTLPDCSVDAVVTDPPYGLSFMGKRWDYDVPSEDVWRECLRVLKPGGHLLAFAGTRTQHRMAVRIEDAGFEIRDMIAWVYGSGFPKSKNLDGDWVGWGTALKPALEPITVARKPLVGTVAENVLTHGTGALNVDGCRVAHGKQGGGSWGNGKRPGGFGNVGAEKGGSDPCGQFNAAGRWPANLIHDGSDEVVECFPQAPGQQRATGKRTQGALYNAVNDGEEGVEPRDNGGSAARFFYCAKASKRDRDEGLEHMPEVHRPNGNKWTDQDYRVARGERLPSAESGPRRNTHPTVKPTDLMRYLCRLVTPPGGVVLDPFMGSGSTGKAANLEGFRFIGVERDRDYMLIAEARVGAKSDMPDWLR
jgi:site-specific DNA-methyltransferase (adenine-specific)